jgi:type I restriction enzyme S subunit
MVNPKTINLAEEQNSVPKYEIPENELNWSTVRLSEIREKGSRFEASLFNIEGKHAQIAINNTSFQKKPLVGENGFATAYHRPRFKRIWISEPGIPIFQPSQIQEINPSPSGFISKLTDTDIDALRVKKNQILMSCSGTIGSVTLVSDTLNNKVFSHDLIRIQCNEFQDIGYIYAFLKTKVGQALIKTNEYGAVVQHIEPDHLKAVKLPKPGSILKHRINHLIQNSYRLRDESNDLMKEAQVLLKKALRLPDIEYFHRHVVKSNQAAKFLNFSVPLSDISNRLDASFHTPVVKGLEKYLQNTAKELTNIGDKRVSQDVILPGHFKRIYVQEGEGIVLIGGKNLYSLDPPDKKYLAPSHYSEKLKSNMSIDENTIIISAKGTPGKVVIAPKHWDGWFISSNLIKIVPSSTQIAGFLYCFLSSPYGQALLKRQIYGSVVDIIEPIHVKNISIPILYDKLLQDKINIKTLEANRKRTEAYNLEQKALRMINEEVIHTQKRNL